MSAYAIIETGSKQYRVEPNQKIEVEKLGLEKPGTVEMDKVLFYSDGQESQIGKPVIEGAKVVCEYLGDKKAPKVISFKYRRRKDSRRKKGHRQVLSELVVKEFKI